MMKNRTRFFFKGIATLLILISVLMELKIIIIPLLTPYTFWIAVVAFGFFLAGSR